MDYFYVSSRHGEPRKGEQGMSTKELKRRLTEIGKSAEGARNVVIKHYEKYAVQEDQERPQDESGGKGSEEQPDHSAHASESPMMVVGDESTGDEYMRALNRKGLGPDGDNHWLVRDMHQELQAWGYPGSAQNGFV